jgi:hypothetical protein
MTLITMINTDQILFNYNDQRHLRSIIFNSTECLLEPNKVIAVVIAGIKTPAKPDNLRGLGSL